MTWTVRAPSGSTQNRAIVLGLAILAAVLGINLTKSIFAGLFAAMAVFFSTSEIWFPVQFTLDEVGAREKKGWAVTEIKWADVKRMVRDSRGVNLSPLEKPSRLDAFRGVYLRFDSNEEAVLAKIASLWRTDELSVG